MDVLDIPQKIIRELEQQQEQLEANLVHGLMKDWDSYKRVVGQREGIVAIKEYIQELVKQALSD